MDSTYASLRQQGIEQELKRQLEITAGALWIDGALHDGQDDAHAQFLFDYYLTVEGFLRRWQALHEEGAD